MRRKLVNGAVQERVISSALSPRFNRSSASEFTSRPQIAIDLPLGGEEGMQRDGDLNSGEQPAEIWRGQRSQYLPRGSLHS
jgi:hypothetical protein